MSATSCQCFCFRLSPYASIRTAVAHSLQQSSRPSPEPGVFWFWIGRARVREFEESGGGGDGHSDPPVGSRRRVELDFVVVFHRSTRSG
ncbi:hypothetical protein C2S52_007527 [Perilla frutescens var. hirtella]|nr:hypothetical protein C2S52_007527 [Perilla frutescens var. hirtella]